MAGVMRANSEEKNLLLPHWRLGHAYFSLLEEMNLNIFGKCDGKGIVHDACQLVKLEKTSYQVVYNRCQIPFQLIH